MSKKGFNVRKGIAMILSVLIVLSVLPGNSPFVYGAMDEMTGIDQTDIELGILKGWKANDTSPTSGAIGLWGCNDGAAVDYQQASLGLDYFKIDRIDRIELWDNNSTSNYENPSEPNYDYLVYRSNDNTTYTQLTETTDWQVTSTIQNGLLVHTFTFSNIEARYIKITTTETDAEGSFVLAGIQTSVKAYQTIEVEYTELGVLKGCMSDDTTPATGVLGSWGANDGAAVDYEGASMGVDYFEVTNIDKIELWDNNSTSNYKNASAPTYDYRVYASNDNATYTLLTETTDWQLEAIVKNGQLVHIFTFNDVEARYVKITTTATYTNASFVLSALQTSIRVYRAERVEYEELGVLKGYKGSDTSPGSGVLGLWGNNDGTAVDYESASIGVDYFEVSKIDKIELRDNNTASNYKSPTTPTYDYRVYVSDDNATYTQLTETTDWKVAASIQSGVLVHTFTFGDVEARYVKITTTQTSANYSFVLAAMQTSIKVYARADVTYHELWAVKGMKASDTSPGTGAIGLWGNTSAAAVDYERASFGVDYSAICKIDKIEIWDINSISNYKKSYDATYDYEVYISDDNLFYTQITDWEIECTIRNGKLVHTFLFGDVQTRYVKITTTATYSGDYSFVLGSIQTAIKAYERVEEYTELNVPKGSNGTDSTPASGALSNWGDTGVIAVDYNSQSIGVDCLTKRKLEKIELWNDTNISHYKKSGSTTYDYLIYISEDNVTYTQTTDWEIECTIQDGKLVHTFFFGDVEARYVKVTTTAQYSSVHSFDLDTLQTAIKVWEKKEYIELDVPKGSNGTDSTPASGALSNWGDTGVVAVDYNSQSVGVDCLVSKRLEKIELWNDTNISHYKKSGATTYDYLIYISEDNVTYTQTTDWEIEYTIRDGRLVHTFVFDDVEARFVKFTTTAQYAGTHSFDLDTLQTAIKVYDIVESAETDYMELSVQKGFKENDTAPASGALGLWGNNDRTAVDYAQASVGVDYKEVQKIDKIQLWDEDSTSYYKNTSGSTYDYLVYISSDNATYTLLSENSDYKVTASVIDGYLAHSFNFNEIETRYVKITTTQTTTSYSFILAELQTSIIVYKAIEPRYEERTVSKGVLEDDTAPGTGSIGNFGANIPVCLDMEDISIGIDFNQDSTFSYVEIQDSDSSNRLAQDDYVIYSSSDNITYTAISSWSFRQITRGGKVIHQFRFYSALPRYLKITTTAQDDSYMLQITDLQHDVKVYVKTLYSETDSLKSALINDTNKSTGVFTDWSITNPVYMDYSSTSVGIDYGERRMADRIDLFSSETTRVGESNYEVFISDDNITYQQVDSWELEQSIQDGRIWHSLYFTDVICRYVKITTDFSDTTQTFEISDMEEDIIAYAKNVDLIGRLSLGYVERSVETGYAENDTAPATGVLAGFGSITDLMVDDNDNSVGIDYGETVKIGKIELRDSDKESTLSKERMEVYISEDNINYEQAEDWTLEISIVNDKKSYCLLFNNTIARYVKITTTSDESTFNLEDIQSDVIAYDRLIQTVGVGGIKAQDYDPESGRISIWGKFGEAAFDYLQTSFGMDFGESKTIAKIEMINDSASTRITKSDYSIYISNDNENDAYTEVEEWQLYESVVDGQLVHTFILPNVTTRYIKITTSYNDQNYTFVTPGELSESMLVYTMDSSYDFLTEGEKQDIGHKDEDDFDRARSPIIDWTIPTPVNLDTVDRSIGIDMGKLINICKIELIDSDLEDSTVPAKYLLYTSEDNIFFTQITCWDYETYEIAGEKVHSFSFSPDTRARYIKINADCNNSTSTFILNDADQDIKVYLSTDINLPASRELPTQTDSEWVDSNKSILVEFQAISDVSKIEIINASISGLITENSFVLEESDNGSNFTTIANWDFSKVSVKGILKSIFDLSGVEAKYVKIKIVDNNESGFVITSIGNDVKGYADLYSEAISSSITYSSGIKVNFGHTDQINSIEIRGYDDTSNPDIEEAAITYSMDDTTYYDTYAYDAILSTDDGVDVITFLFNDLEARYVKIDMDQTGQEQVFAYSRPLILPINMRTGVILSDDSPGSTAVSIWGTEITNVTLDDNNNSVCIDMNKKQIVNRVTIYDDDRLGSCTGNDFKLYYSNDNSTYTEIAKWKCTTAVTDGRLVYIFEFAGIDAQFIKVNFTSLTGDAQLVIDNIQDDVRAFYMKELDVSLPSRIASVLGYCEFDYNPETGAASQWGYDGSFEFDTNMRSIVADLGSEDSFNTIKIYDADAETVLKKEFFSLYVSDDNVTYTEITGWDMFKQDNVITFYNFSSSGRYVKVHQRMNITYYAGFSPTFTAMGNSFKTIMEVYDEAAEVWTLSGGNTWDYSTTLRVDNTGSEDLNDRSVYISKADAGIPNLLALDRVNDDLSDIRFADQNGKELSYYEDDDGFYVRIPFIADSGSVYIDMYYGNPDALKRSDGESTFHVEYGTKTLDIPGIGGDAKYIRLNNGSLMAIYAAVNTSTSRSSIYQKTSTDDGKTWGSATYITCAGSYGNSMGSAITLSNGDIIVIFIDAGYYSTVNSMTLSRCDMYYTRSNNNGVSWSTPIKMFNTGSPYSVTTSTPITIDIGGGNTRIILPYTHVYLDDGTFRSSVMYSDDGGYNWTKGTGNIQNESQGYEGGISECAIIQLANDDLKMYYRVQDPYSIHLGESTSTDNGMTWSTWAYSIVYSPNTIPSVLRDDENLVLMWSGNNTFGGTSYKRTPLNIAYSTDETESWLGYKDVLAGTPFWHYEGIVVSQPDMIFGETTDSLNIIWCEMGRYMPTLRIEDMHNWLYKSFGGGYNDFESENVFNNYWWKLSSGISVTKERSYNGQASLKLEDNLENNYAQAARSFTTGINKGTVKFKLYADNLDSEFNISLRECYSPSEDDAGNMFHLNVTSNGTLRYKEGIDDYTNLPVNTVLSEDTWYDIEMRFDTATGLCKILVNGVDKGDIGIYMDENILNYFYISSGMEEGTGTSIFIDDLIIMDNSVTLPTLYQEP